MARLHAEGLRSADAARRLLRLRVLVVRFGTYSRHGAPAHFIGRCPMKLGHRARQSAIMDSPL